MELNMVILDLIEPPVNYFVELGVLEIVITFIRLEGTFVIEETSEFHSNIIITLIPQK